MDLKTYGGGEEKHLLLALVVLLSALLESPENENVAHNQEMFLLKISSYRTMCSNELQRCKAANWGMHCQGVQPCEVTNLAL